MQLTYSLYTLDSCGNSGIKLPSLHSCFNDLFNSNICLSQLCINEVDFGNVAERATINGKIGSYHLDLPAAGCSESVYGINDISALCLKIITQAEKPVDSGIWYLSISTINVNSSIGRGKLSFQG